MLKRLAAQVVIAFAFLAASCPQAYPQQIGAIEKPVENSWVKAENGLIISWHRGISTDTNTSRINIYNLQGRSLSSFEVLSLVPEAESVSIDDVSARPQQMVAVAAVYVNRQDQSPAAVLLYLNFSGTLVSAVALAPSREVTALALDDDLNVWTLIHSAANDDPAHSPLVVEYSKTGQVVREVFIRSLFPPYDYSIQESWEAGSAAVGYQGATFWFWLPKSTDFVTLRARDGAVMSRLRTGIPQIVGRATWPLQIVRESSGTLIAEMHAEKSGPNPSGLAYYAWSPKTTSWSSFNPACELHRLIGSDSNELIFLRFYAVSTICSYVRE
jgi:hypothetical protein